MLKAARGIIYDQFNIQELPDSNYNTNFWPHEKKEILKCEHSNES